MSINVEGGNKIVIPVEVSLSSVTTTHIDQTTKEVMNYLVSSGAIFPQGAVDPKQDKEGPSGMKQALGLASKSLGGQNALLSDLVAIAPELSEVLIGVGLADYVYKVLQEPGGPLDMRFKRNIPREQEQFLTRQEQAARRYGLADVIITSTKGWGTRLGGANYSSTLVQVRNFGVSKIGLQDKAYGWQP